MLKYIIRDVSAVFRFLPYGIVVGIIVAILLSAVNDRRVRRGIKVVPAASHTCFYMYVVIVLFITFLSRESGSGKGIDLQLFSTFGINERNNAYVAENVLLFVPFGFTCAWAFPGLRKFFRCSLAGFLSSLGIECLQLVTQRGFFQLDDILTNVIGTMVGYILFRCVLKDEETNPRRTRVVYIALAGGAVAVTVMGLIFFASDNSAVPSPPSMKAASFLVEHIDSWLSMGLGSEDKAAVISFLAPVLVKTAYASEYAALAVVIGFGYQMMKRKRARVVNCFYAIMMCCIVGAVDELLQEYVFTGNGSPADVVLDICGALIGGCVYLVLSELFELLAGDE